MSRSTRSGINLGRQAVLVLAGALALALTACSKNQAAEQSADTTTSLPSASSAGSQPSAPGSQPSAPGSQPSAPAVPQPATAPIANAITIATPGMRYDISGALRPGVAAITLTNTDDVAHMMGVARLKDGVTIKQVIQALGKGEDAAAALLADPPDTAYGTPSLVGAGQSTTVIAPALPAGHYALICFLTDGKGMPHWQMGMIGELTVTGVPASEKPSTAGTITVDDKGVKLPAGFTGAGTFEVVNKGAKAHGFSLAKLADGTSLADYAGHVGQAENTGQAVDGGGGVLAGGIDVLAPGGSAYLTLALQPGHYGYLSPEDMTGPALPAQHGEFDVA